eukprot:7380744-Prymnesium_polylepis.1
MSAPQEHTVHEEGQPVHQSPPPTPVRPVLLLRHARSMVCHCCGSRGSMQCRTCERYVCPESVSEEFYD